MNARQPQQRVLRNKVRQVLFVEGHPEFLREDQEQTGYELSFNGKKRNLGKVGKKTIALIKELNESAVCTPVSIRSRRFITQIPRAPGIRIRRAGKNTTIEVSAPDEQELNTRIEAIRVFLAANGKEMTERCQWVCTIDKAKDNAKVAPAKITIGKQEIDLDTAPPALKEAINKQLREKPEGTAEKKPYPECAKCGHNGHTTWCSQCYDGSRFEKGYRMSKKTRELQEMALRMGVK